jgi:hypothetical protein
MKLHAWLLAGICLLAPFLAQAQNPTPDNWRCSGKVGGEWLYGRGPNGCNASDFGPDAFVRQHYGALTFNDAAERSGERRRYMQELYAVLRDASNRYIKSRKPNVSEAERAAFERATFTIAHQESFWSHYRDASDGRIKMMRGDFGHGHGLMQVDDRYHYQAALDGKGWNLLLNYAYSIEEYYTAWERAPSQSCMQGASNTWRNRARAAYSAYNGGPSKICRWTNPNDTWARNDVGFAEKWDGAGYASYVSDRTAIAKVNVPCLMDGGQSCPRPGDPTAGWAGKLLRLSDGAACVFTGGQLQCVSALGDAACLVAITGFDGSSAIDVPAADTSTLTRTNHNRHALCRKGTLGLQALGTSISLSSAQPLKASVNGSTLATAPAGTYQVLDFEVNDNSSLHRHYRIKVGSQEGFIYAGDKSNHATYAVNSAPSGTSLLPTQGDWIKVVVSGGVNLRATPGGALLSLVAQNAVVQIKELLAQSHTNELYYLIEYQGQEGWIYSGALLPTSTRANWTVLAPVGSGKPAFCPSGARYDSQHRLCMDAGNAFGPFTKAMTDGCTNSGGGAVCGNTQPVSIEGKAYNLQQWAQGFAVGLRGNGDCAAGAERSAAHRFHCVETKSDGSKEVYGPFGSQLVSACVTKGGGLACYANRWSATWYLGLLPQ